VMTTTKKNTPFTLHQWTFVSEPGPMSAVVPAASPAPRPAAPSVPQAQPQWVVHPSNPAYEYNTATNEVRARQ